MIVSNVGQKDRSRSSLRVLLLAAEAANWTVTLQVAPGARVVLPSIPGPQVEMSPCTSGMTTLI